MAKDWTEEVLSGTADPQQRIDNTIAHVEYWHKLIAAVERAIKEEKTLSFGNAECREDVNCIYLDFEDCNCQPLTAKHFIDLPGRVAKARAEIQ